MNILCIIPARGGSKAVPKKNIRLLAGKPLIAHTIDAALAVRSNLYRIIVSTDDNETAEIARSYGAEVPFIRPAELAEDTSPTLPVVQHAIAFIEQVDQVRFDWILLLQPTTPFRSSGDIKQALRLAQQESCDSIISVRQVLAEHPILMKRIENNRLLPFFMEEKEGTRRQDYLPEAYMRNGAIYLVRRDVVLQNDSLWGESICPLIMPDVRSINIDSLLDFRFAELLVQEGYE